MKNLKKVIALTLALGLLAMSAMAVYADGEEQQPEIATSYVYAAIPKLENLASKNNYDWIYIGEGQLDVAEINLAPRTFTEAVADRWYSYTLSDAYKRTLLKRYADQLELTAEDIDAEDFPLADYRVTLTPCKISYSYGAADASNVQTDADGFCYHIDMTVSITRAEYASVSYYIWQPGAEGYGDAVKTEQPEVGTSVAPPETAEKTLDGVTYVFDGWYTDSDCTGDQAEFPYIVSEDTVFYGKYTAKAEPEAPVVRPIQGTQYPVNPPILPTEKPAEEPVETPSEDGNQSLPLPEDEYLLADSASDSSAASHKDGNQAQFEKKAAVGKTSDAEATDRDDQPKTDDEAQLMIYLLLAAGAGAGLVIAGKRKEKYKI